MATVKFFGVLSDRAKSKELSLPGDITIHQILVSLGEKYGPEVKALLFEEKAGKLVKRPPVVILINGISQVDLQRVVSDDEVVSIFPAVAGG